MAKSTNQELTIIGAGLAGCEAAWAAAQQGINVRLYEMRPVKLTEAHTSGSLAELVCSNSLGSNLRDRASGLLKEELRLLGSLLVQSAEQTCVPAGNALAVDREAFSAAVETALLSHPHIQLIREEVREIPLDRPVILASGPLTSPELAASITRLTGEDNLFFFDAIAPVVDVDSVDLQIAFRDSRYGRGEAAEGDYLNCPFSKAEYERFVEALLSAERIELKSFETEITDETRSKKHLFFEGCLPVEILAERGMKALAFGPLRPVGLADPRTGKRPWAVLQLRQDNLAGNLYNLVGFQTNLKYPEQDRVFRMIPGLENAVFVRHGQMHRNTYLSAPGLINETLQFAAHPNLFAAGQLCGVEGYMGNIATGLIAGRNAAAWMLNQELSVYPLETMVGSLTHYLSHAEKKHFQPVKANFGILPELEHPSRSKQERAKQYADRSLAQLAAILAD